MSSSVSFNRLATCIAHGELTPKTYAAIAHALKLGADEVGTTTSRLQAVAWVAVRGRAA